MSKSEELKLCPFCGSDAELDQFSPTGDEWQVLCCNGECHASFPWDEGCQKASEVVDSWNTRA